MPALLLIRHGQASFGAADYDELSAVGRDQAELLAHRLPAAEAIASVVSGSLVRQRDTAAPLATSLGLELEIDPRWDEYDSDAVLAGHSDSEIRQDRPASSAAPPVSSGEFQRVLEAALHAWIDAGTGSACRESFPAFTGRVTDGLRAAGARLRRGETGVVVTSGGALAAVWAELLGLPAPALVELNRVTVNAGITRVAVGRSGLTLLSLNEQGHLLSAPGLLTYR